MTFYYKKQNTATRKKTDNYFLKPDLIHKHFSHIYVEEAAYKYAFTQGILKRFPRAEIISIPNYRDIFARPQQNFRLQKMSMKLILAVKKDHFLYSGNDKVQDHGSPHFFYNALMLNCIYDCDYCYLQGMYPSANTVAFVNLEDYFLATTKAIAERKNNTMPLSLALSYDTDLLAFEARLPYCRSWIEYSRINPGLIVEIRTKSANYRSIASLKPHGGVILAWTLSPEQVITNYEKRTASLSQRLKAAHQALLGGWRVRLCFDPVLRIPYWQDAYLEMIEQTFNILPSAQIHDVTLGVFRMSSMHFKKAQKRQPESNLFSYPYLHEDQNVSYAKKEREEMITFLRARLEEYLPTDKIIIWEAF